MGIVAPNGSWLHNNMQFHWAKNVDPIDYGISLLAMARPVTNHSGHSDSDCQWMSVANCQWLSFEIGLIGERQRWIIILITQHTVHDSITLTETQTGKFSWSRNQFLTRDTPEKQSRLQFQILSCPINIIHRTPAEIGPYRLVKWCRPVDSKCTVRGWLFDLHILPQRKHTCKASTPSTTFSTQKSTKNEQSTHKNDRWIEREISLAYD